MAKGKIVSRLRLGAKEFGIPKGDPTKLPQPVPQSKDFTFTTVLANVVSGTSNNALPNGLANTPFYLLGVSAGLQYVLTATPTIIRTAPVYLEFSFNAGDVAARSQSRWFNDSGSSTTEQHFRGLYEMDIRNFPQPVFVPNASNFFFSMAGAIDSSLITSSELFLEVYGKFI